MALKVSEFTLEAGNKAQEIGGLKIEIEKMDENTKSINYTVNPSCVNDTNIKSKKPNFIIRFLPHDKNMWNNQATAELSEALQILKNAKKMLKEGEFEKGEKKIKETFK